ncbi:MAG: hypothetical protein KF736_03515 [Acidobacteria bacterium]|nr:hypothetical protein [Acidobacteriota bacterium]MCW5949481.1 hypothetical protein [Pyrinomonadaceae bacterium]
MNQDHLSAAEVAMFREDSFSYRSIEIGRHLLACKECRAKLPSVTPQEFRECVLGANGEGLDESEYKYRFFDFPILSFARVTAFAGFAILLLAGIYFVGVQKFTTSNTVAKSENNAVTNELNPVPDSVANQANHEKEQLPIKSLDVPSRDSRPKLPLTKTDQRKKAGVTASGPKLQNAETRGSENPCSRGATISLESKADGKEVFLKWNSVKGAESYDIYISDLDENMIDHFESKSQTHYRSAVRLDPAKSYRWKLIITLKNGKKIVGPPQILTSGTSTEDNIESGAMERQRGSFELRCVVSK